MPATLIGKEEYCGKYGKYYLVRLHLKIKSHYVRLLYRLVPSNLVEKLTGEDLLEFHQSVVLGINEEDVWSTAVPTNLPLEGYPGAPGTTGGTGGVGGAVGAGATGAMSPEREEPSMPYHCEYKFPFVYKLHYNSFEHNGPCYKILFETIFFS